MAKEVLLELDEVCKTYTLGDQTLNALNHVNVKILSHEFIAIVGPSGSGKSTFLHVASLLDKPSCGVVKVKGVDVTTYTEPERAHLRNREIGFIFQQFNLLPKTSALDNVCLPMVYGNVPHDEQIKRATEMLDRVGLGDRLKNTPAQLSGGQQQRVAIARALVMNPSIIFADEPTGNLDSHSGKEIQKLLLDLFSEGRTIVMVTHDMKLAEIGNRILTIQDGKVAKDVYDKENS